MKALVAALGFCCVFNMVVCTVRSVEAAETVTLQFTAKGGPYAGQDKNGVCYWSDGLVPHSNADYLIPSGREMGVTVAEGTNVFAGDSLTVEGTLSYAGAYGVSFNLGKPVTFANGTRFYLESHHFTVTADPFVSAGTTNKPVSFYLSRGG